MLSIVRIQQIRIELHTDQLTMKLNFDKGTIQIRGDVQVPNSKWDERSKTFGAMDIHYRDITEFLKRSGLDFKDDVLNLLPCPELQGSCRIERLSEASPRCVDI